MYAIPKEYLGGVVEIFSQANQSITKGTLVSIVSDGIICSNSDLKGELKGLDCVKIHITSGTLPPLYFMAHVHYNGTTLFELYDIQEVNVGDKRQYFRIDCNDDCEIISSIHFKKVKGKLIDLSLGGALFETDLEFKEGVAIYLEIPAPEQGKTVHVTSRILRCEDTGLPNLYRYGVQFISKTTSINDSLCNVIFAKQQRNINRARYYAN